MHLRFANLNANHCQVFPIDICTISMRYKLMKGLFKWAELLDKRLMAQLLLTGNWIVGHDVTNVTRSWQLLLHCDFKPFSILSKIAWGYFNFVRILRQKFPHVCTSQWRIELHRSKSFLLTFSQCFKKNNCQPLF